MFGNIQTGILVLKIQFFLTNSTPVFRDQPSGALRDEPVVGDKEEGGDGDGQLQRLPVLDEVGN